MEHEHEWKPVPLERARYGCACGAFGRRLTDGSIAAYKTDVNFPLLGELAVTVRQTSRQLVVLPSIEYERTAPWSEGWRRRTFPSADSQARRVALRR